MEIKNNKTVQAILDDREALNNRALAVLRNICENYDGKVGIDSDTAIDFCLGFSGCEMCSIKDLFISPEGKLSATVETCEFGLEHIVEISEQDALEVLNIVLSDVGELECTL